MQGSQQISADNKTEGNNYVTGSIVVHYTSLVAIRCGLGHASGKVTHVSVYARLLEGAYDGSISSDIHTTEPVSR